MAVIPITLGMRGDTGGWFLIDTGGLSPVDYGSISDRSHECGYRLLGFREGPWSLLSLRRVLRGRAVISGGQAAHLFSTTNKKRQSPSELLFKGIVN